MYVSQCARRNCRVKLTRGHWNFFLPEMKAQSKSRDVKNSQLVVRMHVRKVNDVQTHRTYKYTPARQCINLMKASASPPW